MTTDEYGRVMALRKKMYGIYQCEWLIEHGYTLDDIFRQLSKILAENNLDGEFTSGEELKDRFEETGIDGALYVCMDEFLDCEYRDISWFRSHLTDAMDIVTWQIDPICQGANKEKTR